MDTILVVLLILLNLTLYLKLNEDYFCKFYAYK